MNASPSAVSFALAANTRDLSVFLFIIIYQSCARLPELGKRYSAGLAIFFPSFCTAESPGGGWIAPFPGFFETEFAGRGLGRGGGFGV
ncbi:hypothetical protein [Azospirillum sp. B510]|uniref:hypothetical protein n=1 Tax=Azospirillum sp. (strain B510) TaxID=137722 RepID=UPI0011D13598|nr:hypothetical protein [Azospirillum sp. B510]